MSKTKRDPIPLIRAFKVTEENDGTGGIVFAKHNAVARREGACLYGDGDWDSVTCVRAPEFDHLSPGPVKDSDLQKAGWWIHCSCGCERKITDGCVEDNEHDREIPAHIDKRDGTVWCSRWGPMERAEYFAAQRRDRAMAIYLAKQALPEGAVVCEETGPFNGGGIGYDDVDLYGPPERRKQFNWQSDNALWWPGPVRGQKRLKVEFYRAMFSFPGAKYLSEWRSNEGTAFVPMGDLYAYYIWRGVDPDKALLDVAKQGGPLPMELAA